MCKLLLRIGSNSWAAIELAKEEQEQEQKQGGLYIHINSID